MYKFLAAFDGLKFSESTKQYAIQLAKQGSAHLVGVFLEDFTYHSYKVYDLIREEGMQSGSRQKHLERKDAELRLNAVENFELASREAGVEHSVHRDRNIALGELLHESKYADLLIIDSTETLTHYPEKCPTRFLRDLLFNTQCPVLVVPHRFKPIDKIIFLYDGEPSSMYAIKMFSYSMNAFKNTKTEVLSVNSGDQSLHLADNRLMKEFMKRHFPQVAYTVLNGSPEIEIVDYLRKSKDNLLVVLGAYSRGTVSRWFRSSMADVLMKDLKLPLYIAHSK